MATSTKKSRGRQKVEMVRMAKDSNRQVTFSKRRTGLFKKASELCTLCGAEAAIIVFSPGKKAFSFGHPSVEMIINRFLINSSLPSNSATSRAEQFVEAHRNANLCDLNVELTLLNNRMEIEKKRGEELNEIKKARKGEYCYWWDIDTPIEELNLQHLVHMKGSLEELRKRVMRQGNKLMTGVSSATSNSFMGIDPMVGFDGAGYGHNYTNYHQP